MNIKEIILAEHGAFNPYSPAGKEAMRLSKPAAQATADATRAGANELSYGYYDKGAAAVNSAMNKTDYDTELKKQYGLSADAKERSPIASKVGQYGSYVLPVGVAATGAKLATQAGGKIASAVIPKVVARSGKVAKTTGNIVTGAAGAIGADASAKELAKQLDPENPYIDEGITDKLTKVFARDLENLEGGGGKIGGAGGAGSASRLRSASAQPTFAQKQQQMSDRVKQNAMAKTTVTPKTPATQPKTSPTDAERLAKVEKRLDKVDPSTARKIANWTARKVGTAAVTGAGLVGAYNYALRPSPDSYQEFLDKKRAERDAAEQAELEKDEQENAGNNQSANPSGTDSTPTPINQTNTDSDNPFDALKTNESSDDLERVRYLTKYNGNK